MMPTALRWLLRCATIVNLFVEVLSSHAVHAGIIVAVAVVFPYDLPAKINENFVDVCYIGLAKGN
jgi:hypothetical protein